MTWHEIFVNLTIHENHILYIKSYVRINVLTKICRRGVPMKPCPFKNPFQFYLFVSFCIFYRYPWPHCESNVATPESLFMYIIKNKLSIVPLIVHVLISNNHPTPWYFHTRCTFNCLLVFKYYNFQFYYLID